MQIQSNNQIEITNFMAEAVSSTIVQRTLGFETEASLIILSEDEVSAIRGGLKIKRSDRLSGFSQENQLKI